MILFSTIYICSVVFLVVIVGLIIKAKRKNIFIASLYSLIGVPILLALLLYVFKEPIQKGKILQNTSLGTSLNFISPPSDLYTTLGSIALEPGKTEYEIEFTHKYLGNHALEVSSPRPSREEQPSYSNISVVLTVYDGESELLRMKSGKVGQFIGRDDYGAFFAWYQVPKDLPVAKELIAKVIISGNLTEFLERRGETTLQIEKHSDE